MHCRNILPILFFSTAAAARQAPAPDAAATPDSAAITVTANRTPTPLDQVASAVTVLDKAAIDASQDIDVATLIARTPGVSFSRTGGYGAATALRIRGAEADQTVLVVDGVKLSDQASPDGSYNFGNLLVGDASRVEILRGPQSTIWGSQAIGGVVNIVTAMPEKPLEASLDVEAGSRQTVDARAGVGGRQGPLAWRVAGENFTTQGVSALAPSLGGHEADGYRNSAASGRALLTLTPDVALDVRGYYSRSHTDQDGYDPVTFAQEDTPEYEIARQFLGYAGIAADLFGGRLKNRLGYSYTSIVRDDYDPRTPAAENTFNSLGRTSRIDYQGVLALLPGWGAVFGVEHEVSRFRSISPQYQLVPDGGRARLTSEYVELNGQPLAGLTLTGGVRHDDYTSYGGRFVFSGGAAWALPTGTVLRARYGEGFRAPSLYQLYSPYGDPKLKPAISHGWEAGIEQKLIGGRLDLGANWFERRTRDEVVFSGLPTPPYGIYQNLARSTAHGVELAASLAPVEGLSLSANYSFILAEDRSPGATYGLWLPHRPRHEVNGSADYRWPFGLSTGVAVRHSGRSFDDTSNLVPLSGYTLVDLRADLPLGHALSLFGRIENVGDRHYMTVYSYGSIGRSVYLGLRGRF